MEQVAQIIAASNGDYYNFVVSHNAGEVGFIGGTYQSVLGRSASNNDISYWVSVHAAGVSNTQIAEVILNSGEHLAQVVSGYYQTYLHRGIDPGGLNYWVSVMQRGVSPQQVMSAIIGSDEYYQTNGGTSDAYVRALYRDVLHRSTPPSQPEVDYWIAVMAASNRGSSQARRRRGPGIRQ